MLICHQVSRGRKKQFIEHFEIRVVIYYIKYISSGREMRYAVHLRTHVANLGKSASYWQIRNTGPCSYYTVTVKIHSKNNTSCGKKYSLENSRSTVVQKHKQPCIICLWGVMSNFKLLVGPKRTLRAVSMWVYCCKTVSALRITKTKYLSTCPANRCKRSARSSAPK